MISAWRIAQATCRVRTLLASLPMRNRSNGKAMGKSPPITTAGNVSERRTGPRVERKYCQSKPDSTKMTVITMATRCQEIIRPLKQLKMLRGNVERNCFMQPVYADWIETMTKIKIRTADFASTDR